MAANNWSTVSKMPVIPNKETGILLYTNVAGVEFLKLNGNVVANIAGNVPKLSPPPFKNGCVFGAAPLCDTCYSYSLISKLAKLKGSVKQFQISLELPELSKEAFALAASLESKPVLTPWYLDQAVCEEGSKAYLSGDLKLIHGPLCADYVRFAAGGFQKSLAEQMKIVAIVPKIIEQFEKAFDLVAFWQWVILLDDLLKEMNPDFAVGKAQEIGALAAMVGDPRVKSLMNETFEACFPQSSNKKDWKELVL